MERIEFLNWLHDASLEDLDRFASKNIEYTTDPVLKKPLPQGMRYEPFARFFYVYGNTEALAKIPCESMYYMTNKNSYSPDYWLYTVTQTTIPLDAGWPTPSFQSN
jgi:hypothetical protein